MKNSVLYLMGRHAAAHWPFIVLSLGVSLMLAGLMHVLHDTAQSRSISAHETVAWVFLRPGSTDDRVRQVADQVKALPAVISVETVTAAQSLEHMRQMWSDVDTTLVDGRNPFQPYLLVRPRDPFIAEFRRLVQALRLLDNVEEVTAAEESARLHQHQSAMNFRVTVILYLGGFFIMCAAVVSQARLLRARRWTSVRFFGSIVLGCFAGLAGFGIWKFVERIPAIQAGIADGYSLLWVCLAGAVLTVMSDADLRE